MKILILSHAQYITVGLPKIIEYAESLNSLGHDVTLCVTSKANRWGINNHTVNGIKIIESPSLLFGSLRHGIDPFDVINRVFYLKDKYFDIVHCVASRPTVFYPALYLKRRQKVKIIYEWEDSFGLNGVALERGGATYCRLFGWIEKYFEESILKYADGVIVVSEFLKNRALQLGFKQENILKQIKGVKFAKIPDQQFARVRLLPESEKNAIVFTYAGSIYESDLGLMLKAFEKVSIVYPEVRLRLIGYNRKWPKTVPANVKILPRIPDEDYNMNIAATDVFLLPLKSSVANISRYPSKFGDYLAAGRPVISTPHPEISRIINTAACGYISEDDSIDAVSETILKALKDRNNWETMGRNARDYALNQLSWNRIGERLIAFYNRIALKEKV